MAATIKIALVSRTIFYAPVWVAEQNGYFRDEGVEAQFEIFDNAEKINEVMHAGVAQIAIAWLLAKQVVSSVIIGASKPHQLEDNLKAADLKLSGEELAELDAITAPTRLYPNWFNTNLVDPKQKAAIEEV